MTKRKITYDEAVSLLPNRESIHTFYNPSFGLVGADWSREDLLDKLKKSDTIELCGENAREIGHGIAAYNQKSQRQMDILFIETDPIKLAAFDKENEEAGE